MASETPIPFSSDSKVTKALSSRVKALFSCAIASSILEPSSNAPLHLQNTIMNQLCLG
jgi:hypothetical protein